MKKTFAILLSLMIVITLLMIPAIALADSAAPAEAGTTEATAPETTDTVDAVAADWSAVIIENAVKIVAALCITLITAFGAWLTSVLGKNKKYEAINAAQKELINMAKITVGELQQTLVDKLKTASEDGKLRPAEINQVNTALLAKTKEKMSGVALDLLAAAAVDVNKLILGKGEELVGKMKLTEDSYLFGAAETTE